MRRILYLVLGGPLLAFGLVILLGAVVRFGSGDLKYSLSGYLAAILLGGMLPSALGLFLIIKGIKKRG